MFKKIFIAVFFAFTVFGITAQNIAVIDVSEILENMDDYKNAQKEIDKLSEQYRQIVITEQDKVRAMYNKYEAEVVLMTEDMKKRREEEIMAKEKEIRELQRGFFGPEGELFQKRSELVQPIENRVFAAITEYAEERRVDLVIDRSLNSGLLFVGERFDKTADIKRKLGIQQ
jgi:outer membrane protein